MIALQCFFPLGLGFFVSLGNEPGGRVFRFEASCPNYASNAQTETEFPCIIAFVPIICSCIRASRATTGLEGKACMYCCRRRSSVTGVEFSLAIRAVLGDSFVQTRLSQS